MIMSKESWNSLKRSALASDSNAQFDVALGYDEGVVDEGSNVILKKDPKRAVFWYKRSAEQGNSSAQNNLGYCFDSGHGIRKNINAALYWYKRAFKNGHPASANNIATVYRDKGNNRRAFFWYKRAMEMGDGDATFEVGLRYYYGIGVRRDRYYAVELLRKAIYSDNITEYERESAMYHLGMAFFEGKGVKRSNTKAMKWFKKANKYPATSMKRGTCE